MPIQQSWGCFFDIVMVNYGFNFFFDLKECADSFLIIKVIHIHCRKYGKVKKTKKQNPAINILRDWLIVIKKLLNRKKMPFLKRNGFLKEEGRYKPL